MKVEGAMTSYSGVQSTLIDARTTIPSLKLISTMKWIEIVMTVIAMMHIDAGSAVEMKEATNNTTPTVATAILNSEETLRG